MFIIPVTGNSLITHIEYDQISYSRERHKGIIPYTLVGNQDRLDRVYHMTESEGEARSGDNYIDGLLLAKEGLQIAVLPPETPVE